MCRRRLRREPTNERFLQLLQAGVLLLFTFVEGLTSFPDFYGRLLPAVEEDSGSRGYSYAGRRLLQAELPAPPPPSPAVSPFMATVGGLESSDSGSSQRRNFLLLLLLIVPAALALVALLAIGSKIRSAAHKYKGDDVSPWMKGIREDENDALERSTFAGMPSSTVEDLEAACEEFTNVISACSDCITFKGIRPSDSLQIAVTRITIPPSNWTAKKEIDFRHKVQDLARMNHDNLVNLLAYATSEKPFERMLVFEYASNGTLYEHLHGPGTDEDHLDWRMRMRIIMGAAYGLQYMHHELDPPASHFKFDASHVFLTEDYAAKVADFGISAVSVDKRSLGRRRSFKKIVRNIGYRDWDGYRHRPYFDSNIRSFGVFLLETISGRPPYTESQGPLIEWAKDYLADPDKMWVLADPTLKSYKKQELIDVCQVARLCIQPKASTLPTMREVTEMLSNALHMTQEVANSKGSPLLWAELELLASLDGSSDDAALLSVLSRPQELVETQSSNKATDHISTTKPTVSSLPNLSKEVEDSTGGPLNKSSHRLWTDNASELELVSASEEASTSDEDPEAPLAGPAMAVRRSDSVPSKITGSQASLGRSFRPVWIDNATELSKLDLRSPGALQSSNSGHLGR